MAFDILNRKVQPAGLMSILRRKVQKGAIPKLNKPKTARTTAKEVIDSDGQQVPKLEVIIT